MLTYKLVVSSLSDIVNKSEYFNPFFSWVIIAFTFFSIGIHGGPIWNYLFFCASIGFMAISCSFIYTIAENLNYRTETFIKLMWIEGILWAFNEWFYVYINYIKIQTCIKSLRKKYIKIFLFLVLLWSLFFRFRLTKLEYEEKLYTITGESYNKNDYEKRKGSFLTHFYFPLGLICAIFIYFIIKELFQENEKYAQKVLSSLLHSTLSRMLIVSMIFIGVSIIVMFKEQGVVKFIRHLFMRLKGNLGLIFLIDILLLRIDLDHNQIALQDQEIEKMNVGRTIQDQFDNYNEEQITLDKVNKLLSDVEAPFNHHVVEEEIIVPPQDNLYIAENSKKVKHKKIVPSEIYFKQHLNTHINSKYYTKSREEIISSGNLPYIISKQDDVEVSNNSNRSRKLKDTSNLPYMISKSLDEENEGEQFYEKPGYINNPLSSYISSTSGNINNLAKKQLKSPLLLPQNIGSASPMSSNSYSYGNYGNTNKPTYTTSYKNKQPQQPVNKSPINTKGNATKHPGNIVLEYEE